MPNDPEKKKKPAAELPWLHEYITPDPTPTRRLGPAYQSKRPVRQGLPEAKPRTPFQHLINAANPIDQMVRKIGYEAKAHPLRTIAENAPLIDIPTNAAEGGAEIAKGNVFGGVLQAAMAPLFGGGAAKGIIKGATKRFGKEALTHEGLTAFHAVKPDDFHAALSQFAEARPSEAGYITWRTPEEMQTEGMQTFLSSDGTSGYAIHPETGDIRNVFNFGEKGRGAHAVADAIANRGGKILDAFDSNLGDFYRDMGFNETDRLKWSDEYAPSNWDFDKYGRPDVVMMQHPKAGAGVTAGDLIDTYDANRLRRKAASGKLGVQAEATTTQAQRTRDQLFHATQPLGQRGPMPEAPPVPPARAPETMRVFHGTQAPPFDQFRVGHAPGWGDGIYFTDNEGQALSEFGSGPKGRVISADVTLNNPYREETLGEGVLEGTQAWKDVAHKWPSPADAWQEDSKFVSKALRELGYDGIIAKGSNGIEGKEVVAFHPEQIKQVPPTPATPAIHIKSRPEWLNPRGVFDRSAPKIQGQLPSDARLVPPPPRTARASTSPLVDAIMNSKTIRRGLDADVDKGMTMGGPEWYELGPIRADLDARAGTGAMSFHDFNMMGAGASQSNSVPSELSAMSIINYARTHGLSREEAVQHFLEATGWPKKAPLMGSHMNLGLLGIENGAILPADPWSDAWKIPMYADKRMGGGGLLDVTQPGGMPALDTHERRRIMQLVSENRNLAKVARETGAAAAAAKNKGALPLRNAQDYQAISSLYTDGAQRYGLPTAGAYQAPRWTGGWKETGLKSPPSGDFVQILEDALKYTAQQRGMDDTAPGLRSLWGRVAEGKDFILPWSGKGYFPIR